MSRRLPVRLTFDEWDEVTDLLHSVVEDLRNSPWADPGRAEERARRVDRLNGRILRQVNRGLASRRT